MSVAVPARGPARRRAAKAEPKAVRRARPRRRRVTAGGLVWVAVLATLMFGIVALNVAALRGSIDVSRMRDRVQQLEQQNGLLRNETINLSNPYAIGRKARGYGMVPSEAITTKHVRLTPRSSGDRPAP
ncbi:MAG TPA: hypothetical protein VHI30_11095 [Gaiellales bacterium]|nr:hypothetical protein [Gaiellales bacterium]